MTNIWDIVQPKDDWQRGYAKLEYARIGLYAVYAKKIQVKEGGSHD